MLSTLTTTEKICMAMRWSCMTDICFTSIQETMINAKCRLRNVEALFGAGCNPVVSTLDHPVLGELIIFLANDAIGMLLYNRRTGAQIPFHIHYFNQEKLFDVAVSPSGLFICVFFKNSAALYKLEGVVQDGNMVAFASMLSVFNFYEPPGGMGDIENAEHTDTGPFEYAASFGPNETSFRIVAYTESPLLSSASDPTFQFFSDTVVLEESSENYAASVDHRWTCSMPSWYLHTGMGLGKVPFFLSRGFIVFPEGLTPSQSEIGYIEIQPAIVPHCRSIYFPFPTEERLIFPSACEKHLIVIPRRLFQDTFIYVWDWESQCLTRSIPIGPLLASSQTSYHHFKHSGNGNITVVMFERFWEGQRSYVIGWIVLDNENKVAFSVTVPALERKYVSRTKPFCISEDGQFISMVVKDLDNGDGAPILAAMIFETGTGRLIMRANVPGEFPMEDHALFISSGISPNNLSVRLTVLGLNASRFPNIPQFKFV